MSKKNLRYYKILLDEEVIKDFHLLFCSSGFDEKGQLFTYLIDKEILKFYKDSNEFNAFNIVMRFKVAQLNAQRGITRLSLKKLTQTRNIEKLLDNLEQQGHIKQDGEIQDVFSLRFTLRSLALECGTLNNVAGLEILKNKIDSYQIPELTKLYGEIEEMQHDILNELRETQKLKITTNLNEEK